MLLSFRYDMRAPDIGPPPEVLYRAALEQVAWADRVGLHSVYLGEHHGADDGYLPSSIVLGAAMAANTARIRIHLSALVAVLHDPLRLAEDLAVLDLVSGGRLDVTLGAGYRPHEYGMFGIEQADRMARLEAAFAVLPQAWTGEPFEYDGRHVVVRPRPVQRPGPPLYFGATTEAAARRAARMGVAINPTNPALTSVYAEECARLGQPVRPPMPVKHDMQFLFVTDDPERDWPVVAPHVLHTNNSYATWALERAPGSSGFRLLDGIDDLKAHPRTHMLTPLACVEFLDSLGPDAEMIMQPLMGGLPPDVAAQSLDLIEHQVIPRLATF